MCPFFAFPHRLRKPPPGNDRLCAGPSIRGRINREKEPSAVAQFPVIDALFHLQPSTASYLRIWILRRKNRAGLSTCSTSEHFATGSLDASLLSARRCLSVLSTFRERTRVTCAFPMFFLPFPRFVESIVVASIALVVTFVASFLHRSLKRLRPYAGRIVVRGIVDVNLDKAASIRAEFLWFSIPAQRLYKTADSMK